MNHGATFSYNEACHIKGVTMFIEKEPAKAAEAKKMKEEAAREPVKDPKKREVPAGGFAEQSRKASPRTQQESKPRLPAAPENKDPVEELRRLFRENNLPEKLVPTNVVDFRHDPSSGALTITLKSGFSKKFDEENTVTFDRTISGVLKPGSFSGLSGVTKGSATITAMSRSRPGKIAISGKLGPFSKTLEFEEASLPSLP